MPENQHPAAPKASRLDQMLPDYWGEADNFEEARTMALIAQAKALEGIENAVTLIASDLLDGLEEINDRLRELAELDNTTELEVEFIEDEPGKVLDT